MKATATQHADPADDARRAHRQALVALRDAAARNSRLWRRIDNPGARVPDLEWTAGETAAHVVGDLRESIDGLGGETSHAAMELSSASPSRIAAVVNARQLDTVRERNMQRLADLLDDEVARYVAAAENTAPDSTATTPNGLATTPATLTSLVLGEQLLHGLDIARASHQPWPISREDALLVIPGVLNMAPHYLHRSRGSRLRASFELRMRGGGRYRFAVNDGAAHIGAAGDKSDCVITADPVAFLLLGYGRIPQWVPIVRGQLLVTGRKPWLATKFATLLTRP